MNTYTSKHSQFTRLLSIFGVVCLQGACAVATVGPEEELGLGGAGAKGDDTPEFGEFGSGGAAIVQGSSGGNTSSGGTTAAGGSSADGGSSTASGGASSAGGSDGTGGNLATCEHTFTFDSAASEVLLTGTFVAPLWAESEAAGAISMQKQGEMFSATVTISEGSHEYKYIADGVWTSDASQPTVGSGAETNNTVECVP